MASRGYPGRPRLQEINRRIEDAAISLVGRYGSAETSVADIAKTARVTKPTVYLRFREKDALIHACVQRLAKLHSPASPTESWENDLDTVLRQLRALVTQQVFLGWLASSLQKGSMSHRTSIQFRELLIKPYVDRISSCLSRGAHLQRVPATVDHWTLASHLVGECLVRSLTGVDFPSNWPDTSLTMLYPTRRDLKGGRQRRRP